MVGINKIIWLIQEYLFYGKMWSIFSMLFGAGAYLLITRAEKSGRAAGIADIYYRRLIWLLIFGLIHSYIIWSGDILFFYAVVGLFLYPLRKLSVKWMLILASALFIISVVIYVNRYRLDLRLNRDAEKIENLVKGGDEISEDQKATLDKWNNIVSTFNPEPKILEEKIEVMRQGNFWKIKKSEKDWVIDGHTDMFYNRLFIVNLVIMIIGMALIKSGVLSGNVKNRTLLIMMLIGYSIGFTSIFFKTDLVLEENFEILALDKYSIFNQFDRLAVAIGHIGLLCLFAKSGILKWLKKSLAAVGRMAFSNYIMHSIICTIIFYGYGFGLYGGVNMAWQMIIVVIIWILQMIYSPLWLKHFRFGPLEWVWRTLTYWKRQPMRIK